MNPEHATHATRPAVGEGDPMTLTLAILYALYLAILMLPAVVTFLCADEDAR